MEAFVARDSARAGLEKSLAPSQVSQQGSRVQCSVAEKGTGSCSVCGEGASR